MIITSLLLLVSPLFIGVLLTSCDGRKKITPEDEVRNYGKYFVDKLAANQLDSLTASYPDIAKADSIKPITSDTIIISENGPGQFDVALADGITLKVNRSDDGNLTVIESKGLFAFPTDKVDIAKKTGMLEDNLNDAELSKRMDQQEFFDYIAKRANKAANNILSVGKKMIVTGYEYDVVEIGYYTITNNTDQTIYPKDYKMEFLDEIASCEEEKRTIKHSSPGKKIDPKSTIKVPSSRTDRFCNYEETDHLVGVTILLTPEEIQKRFAPYTGKEYQEYLDSKNN